MQANLQSKTNSKRRKSFIFLMLVHDFFHKIKASSANCICIDLKLGPCPHSEAELGVVVGGHGHSQNNKKLLEYF
jgi:hypothetical protein